MSLTGSATGSTRADLIRKAASTAADYYETECVVIDLSNEQCEYVHEGNFATLSTQVVATKFAADWKAQVQHLWEERAYGFPKCRKCQREHTHLS